ncbi:two-component response regulator ARR10-like [Capsicum annuum]
MDDKGLGNTISIPSCARGLRIFVVDPDTSSLLHTATILEDQSYKVTTIEFPNIALSLIQEKEDQYDLVIVEVDMPEMDGFTFLKHIIRETDIPIILMSQKANLEMGKRALEGGACFFETKPLRVKDLINVWQHIFHNKVKAMLEKVNKRRLTYQEEESFTEQNKRKCRQVNMKEKKKEEAEVHINNLEQKQRLIWTPQLHLKFLKAVDALGGEKSMSQLICYSILLLMFPLMLLLLL